MKHVGWPCLVLIILLLASVALIDASAQSESANESTASAQLPEDGSVVFADHCSVCHGATGLGLVEAKEAFPPDHRRCQRCHKPGNPATMSLAQVELRQHDLFDVGTPPPLRGEGALASHAAPEALRAYVQAAMPRYRPGTLSSREYDAVTEFLLELNGR